MSQSSKLWHCDIWKCHKMSHFFKSLVQSYVYLLCLDLARNGFHCLSRDAEHIRLAAFRWRCDEVEMRRNLFGSWKIDADKSCNQLLRIVLRYRRHLHEESVSGIFRYSKEWKSFTIDIVSKIAKNTHLTAEPILKQCAVYGSRPPIASKPGSSSPEQYGLHTITGQAWSEATYPRTTSDSAYFRFVTLF